ncbi:hypothetical protein PVK06_004742 [Gossypium arboreum]|uniref:Uncharacterized protein n=1 Tax=Gossypium arboreum TaxID=29729 RepID=A0ABR0QU34_GOSAR|nr:hypothetical protein PVK06_004742 [Gossypium arboreum]
MHNQELERDEARTGSVHIESDDDGMDTIQTTAAALQSETPMTAQECAVHQLIDEITKSDTDDDEEEVPINQLKRKRFKMPIGKTIQGDSDDLDRSQRYK